jgi:tryptophanase
MSVTTARPHRGRQSDVDYVIEVCQIVAEEASTLRGCRITFQPPSLRHFSARSAPL